MNSKGCLEIIEHYEQCLAQHGDNHLGVDWPKREDVGTRYQVMLDLIRKPIEIPVALLDFGCGASHLYEYLLKENLPEIHYTGLDLSRQFSDYGLYEYTVYLYKTSGLWQT